VYSFAYTFLNTLYSFTAWVVFNTFNPRVYAAHNRDEIERRDVLQTYMLKAALASFILPSVVLFAVARPMIELVAQAGYVPAATVLPVVAVSFVMIIVAYPAHSLLTLQDRVFTLAIIDIAGMAIGLAGNFLLVPTWSYWGAAAASVAGLGTAAILKYACTDMSRRIRLDVLFSLRAEWALLRSSIDRLRHVLA
jgi:O-antigen/teichoic acid export membrane protein